MQQAQPMRDSARKRDGEGPGPQNLGIDLDLDLNSEKDMGMGLGTDRSRKTTPLSLESGPELGPESRPESGRESVRDSGRELRRETGYPGLSRTNPDLFGLSRLNIVSAGTAHKDTAHTEMAFDTLTVLPAQSETFAEVAHDARNMVTALGLYCDLLEEPGVLATPFIHYGHELRLVVMASRRLVEKIVTLDSQTTRRAAGLPAVFAQSPPESARLETARPEPARLEISPAGSASPKSDARVDDSRRWDLLPAAPVTDMAAELVANRNLLAALAGPSIVLTVQAHGGARPVRLTGEDLTRVLVNLVKNSAEAMPTGGRIHIGLTETGLLETGSAETGLREPR